MSQSMCSQPDCDRPAYCRGMCQLHYGRAYRAGDLPPLEAKPRITDIDEAAGTVTCPVHGPGSKLRIRPPSAKRGRFACRKCHLVTGGNRGTPESRRLERIKRKYGIAVEEYRIMEAAQGGLCLICRTPPEPGDGLVVDHDHASGLVRGLLCRPCNLGLGFMRDSPENLTRAAKYLRRPTG